MSYVNDCIDEILGDTSIDETWRKYLQERNLYLQRVKKLSELKSSKVSVNDDTSDSLVENLSSTVPYFFAIGIYPCNRKNEPCGILTMYIAYSTWDGRCLFLDRLDFPNPDDVDMEKKMLRLSAKVAVKLGCARLNWRVSKESRRIESLQSF